MRGVYLMQHPWWSTNDRPLPLSTGSTYIINTVRMHCTPSHNPYLDPRIVFDNEAAVVFRHRWRTASPVSIPLSPS